MTKPNDLIASLLQATERGRLIWQPTHTGDAFRAELGGIESIVWFNEELEIRMLTIRDDRYGDVECGDTVDELYNAVHRQLFYRSDAPARLLASLKALSADGDKA